MKAIYPISLVIKTQIKLLAMTQGSKYPHNSQQLFDLAKVRPLEIHLPNEFPHLIHTILQLPVHDQGTHTHRRKNRIPRLADVFQPQLFWHLLGLQNLFMHTPWDIVEWREGRVEPKRSREDVETGYRVMGYALKGFHAEGLSHGFEPIPRQPLNSVVLQQ
jgi:hypothetical protein